VLVAGVALIGVSRVWQSQLGEVVLQPVTHRALTASNV
jgi:hypothetical protein